MLKSRSNPNLGSRLKEEDKLFTSLFSKESSAANPSFRVYYADHVPSAVPFVWETQPGTPKHNFSSKNHENNPPTLRPPPSFYFTPTRDHKPAKTHSMSRSTQILINNLKNIVPPYKKNQLSSSPSSSSSSSSSYSSASEKARVIHSRRRLLSIGSAFDDRDIYEFSATKKRSLHNSMLVCFVENWPCKVMDKHLSILAKQHIETRFVKLNAEKSPFLTEKLKIVVLPTLALVKKAKVEDYVVGFDELGGTDDFGTEELEDRLAKAQVIILEGESSLRPSKSSAKTRSVRQGTNPDSSDSE